MTRLRVLAAAVVAAVAATMAAAGLAPVAEATTYRYWVYWHYTDGSWHYSGVGPSGYRVPDGGVEGWRFGRGESSSAVVTPRLGGEYDQLCPDDPASADGTQVAVVIDYGTEADSPGYPYSPAHCVTLTGSHQGSDALVKAAGSVRVEQGGLVCAIRNYPKAPECGKTVDDPKPSSKPTPKPVTTTASTTQQQPAQPSAQVSALNVRRSTSPISTAQPRPTGSALVQPSQPASTTSPQAPAAAAGPGDLDRGHPHRVPVGLIAGGLLVLALGSAAAVKARR